MTARTVGRRDLDLFTPLRVKVPMLLEGTNNLFQVEAGGVQGPLKTVVLRYPRKAGIKLRFVFEAYGTSIEHLGAILTGNCPHLVETVKCKHVGLSPIVWLSIHSRRVSYPGK